MSRIKLQGFWEWAFSDLMSNTLRGILAEYIVSNAIGCTHRPRKEWDAYDLKTEAGLKIEVKSSAYLQSWQQKKPSTIRFDIGHKKAWDAETNISSANAIRSADLYVFCVFSAIERVTADPLDLSQWFFIVSPANFLNEKFAQQKTVGLASLEQQGLKRLPFEQLFSAIDDISMNRAKGL